MGRPIPEIQPIKPPEPKDTDDKAKSGGNNRNHARKAGMKRTAAPKITFVGGTKLTTTGVVKSDAASDGTTAQIQPQASKEDESMDASTEGEGIVQTNANKFNKLQLVLSCLYSY